MDRRNNKENNIENKRLAGILLPIASLNSDEGSGNFGKEAYEFIDIISEIGFKIWQILPLNPLGYGNSPYQPYSSFAGDEIYVSLEKLYEENILKEKPEKVENTNRIDYIKLRKYKEKYLKKAYKNFKKDKDFLEFTKNSFVYNYAVFRTLKNINDDKVWNKWEKPLRDYDNAINMDLSKYQEEIDYHLFTQYIFHKQLISLRKYANSKNVKIMGDIPIYVGLDSQDVWENKENFLLNRNYNPKFIAGVPPDIFSKKGQRWGNPIYDWDYMRRDGFEFWLKRLSYNEKLYDIVRIDHFRAFETYYKINSRNKTAIAGEWKKAPGYELLDKVFEKFPNLEIVAEDLGATRKQVFDMRDHYNLKGMIILQFALEGRDMTKSTKSKKNFNKKNAIIYTGTHDNMTMKSWYENLDKKKKAYVKKVLKDKNCLAEKMEDKFVEYLFKTEQNYAIIPLQDILGLDDEARINMPGTVNDKNWSFRFKNMKEFIKKKDFLKKLIINTNRI